MGYTQKILGCWGMLVDHWVLRHYRLNECILNLTSILDGKQKKASKQ